MNRYIIYCTEEQTKKALALGAPIIKNPYAPIIRYETCGWIVDDNKEFVYLIPTADEMIGWLEEQELCIDADWSWSGQVTMWVWDNTEKELVYTSNANSRQESTLEVIDAALDYLIKNKK